MPLPADHQGATFLRVERKNDYAVVTLQREPVNTMNLDMWEALSATLDELEASTVRGVIFQSGLRRDVFTAGNDILELYAPRTSEERYK
jgi:Delta3-Delta2-enoyl-CoA isomerase